MRKSSGNDDENRNRESISTDFLQRNGSKNLRGVTLYSYRSMFLLKPTKESLSKKQLWIDRNTARPAELSDLDEAPPGFNMVKDYSTFLGIINIMDCQYLMMVDDAVPICNMGGHMIYTISAISFVAMEVENALPADKKKILLNYLVYIQKLLSFGYYFSPTYDLTLSRHNNCSKSPTDRKFQWNYALYKDLNKFNIDPAWQVPLIQGYVGSFTTTIDNKTLEYFLISRRSCLNSGTRYYARGLDDNSNVANFVETEQLIFHQDTCCSQTQVRGSVPVFWKQKGLQAIIKLERTYELTNHVFLNHIKQLTENYGYVICLNLMSRARKDEQMITDAFENHLKTNHLNDVGYEYFDFHGTVKNQKFENVNVLLYKIQPPLDSFGFHVDNTVTGAIEQSQKGVVRTNCLDCLDRTNYVQSKIAITALGLMLERFDIHLRGMFGKEAFEEMDNIETKHQYTLMINFKNIWADNGDALSMHYTGTGSVISDVTRVGKRSIFGMFDHGMKSINRFYNGSFEDKLKQECLDFLLGKHIASSNMVNEAYELEIQSREKEFSVYTPLNVFIVTWNVAGSAPDSNLDLRHLFNSRSHPAPDMLVVGLQEVVNLNPSTVMSNNHQKPNISLWKDCILSTLRKHDKYICVSEVDLVGLLLLVFVKEEYGKRIFGVETDKVKTGLAGTLGNKGGVIVKLHVDDTTFAFVNCHLVPSASKLEDRLENLLDIYRKAFQQEEVGVRKRDMIMNLDVKFLLGDTNFRLSTGHNARVLIGDYKYLKAKGEDKKALEVLRMLQKYDQLLHVRDSDNILKHYKEGVINFLPTYKYDPFSEEYDTSKKQRVPAWTDRILWSSDEAVVEQHFYDRVEYMMSDHRPVVSYFTVQVKRVDKIKKDEITKQVYEYDRVEDLVIKVAPEKVKVVETKLEEGENISQETKETELIDIDEFVITRKKSNSVSSPSRRAELLQ